VKALDLFCGGGGTGEGLARAGFEVTGVDKADHSRTYPHRFIRADAVEYGAEHGPEYDLIVAGPPCQNQIRITAGNRARAGYRGDHHVNLIPATRTMLQATGVPYVIENGPSDHLRPDVVLCGLMFGLPTLRDRYFELGGWFAPNPVHPTHRGHLTAGYRHGCRRTFDPSRCPKHDRWCRATVYGVYGKGGGKPTVGEAQHALGITWMEDISVLNEAIPPVYAEYLGRWFGVWRSPHMKV